MANRGRGNDWVREAFTPKMIALFLFLALAAGICIRLGYWQFERATARGAERIATEHSETLGAPVEPLHDVLRLQTTMTGAEYARPVYVTGTYSPNQLRVIDRSIDGTPADLVLAQFTITEGPDAGGHVPVVRGWVPEGEPLPAAPTGEVTVFGYLSGPEDSIGGLTDNTALSISSGELVNAWGSPILSGYMVEFGAPLVNESSIEQGLAIDVPMEERSDSSGDTSHVPPPKPTEEGGFNLQNAAYAVEWIVFAGFALFIWGRILRSNVIRRREDDLLDEWAEEFVDTPTGDPVSNHNN